MAWGQVARVREREQGVAEGAHDVGDGRAGLELHLEGVGEGNELALAVEIERDEGPLDGGDHSQRLLVPVDDGDSSRFAIVGDAKASAGMVASRGAEGEGVERRSAGYGAGGYGGWGSGGGSGASKGTRVGSGEQ